MADAETADDGGLRGAVESAIETVESQPKESDLLSALSQSTEEDGKTEQTEITEQQPAATADEQQSKPAEQAEKPLDPHANWSKEAKERFAKLDKPSQEFLLERERSMQADYTKKTQEIAALRRDYEPVDKLFTPYKDQMKASGHTPYSLIEGWANVEKALMAGKGLDVIAGLVRGYKIDPKSVVSLFSGAQQHQSQTAQQPTPGQQAFQLPPEVAAKLQKIDQFESRFAAEDQARKNAEISRVAKSIEDFKSAKDDKGNALHPHFDEVEPLMATFAQVMRAQGKEPTLQELYESAVHANPSTHAKVLTAEKQAEEKRVKDEARAKAEKARKASLSVTGSGNSSGQPLANGRDNSMSLRDQIAQSYSEVSS